MTMALSRVLRALLFLLVLLHLSFGEYIGCYPWYSDSYDYVDNYPLGTGLANCQFSCSSIPRTYYLVRRMDDNTVECYCADRLPEVITPQSCSYMCNGDCGGPQSRSVSSTCNSGSWGTACKLRCYCEDNTVCTRSSGACPGGCQSGYWTPSCNKECHCEGSNACSLENGHCDDVCKSGYWGDSCSSECHCGNNEQCDRQIGSCPSDCAPGWHGATCGIKSCPVGLWDSGCDKQCHCVNADPCDSTTGLCPNGCATGWSGDVCDQCATGYYGNLCNLQCHCANDDPCPDGVCPNGCTAGWSGGSCSVADNCSMSGGECSQDCAPGWTGPDCSEDLDECDSQGTELCNDDKVCENIPGSYICACMGGYRLSNISRVCVDVDECTENSHICSHGCKNTPGSYLCQCPGHGREGQSCVEVTTGDTTQDNNSSKSSNPQNLSVPAIGGIAAGAGLAVIIILIILITMVRRRKTKSNQSTNSNKLSEVTESDSKIITSEVSRESEVIYSVPNKMKVVNTTGNNNYISDINHHDNNIHGSHHDNTEGQLKRQAETIPSAVDTHSEDLIVVENATYIDISRL